jgi:hypothetical protein
VGYHVLRFAFHPGDATLPSLGARVSVHMNLVVRSCRSPTAGSICSERSGR